MDKKSRNGNIIKLLSLGSIITFLFILIPMVLLYSSESNTFVLFIVIGGFLLSGLLMVVIREFRNDFEYGDSVKFSDDSGLYFKKHCDSISENEDFEANHYSKNIKNNVGGDNFLDDEEEKLFSLNTRDYELEGYRKL